MSGHSHSSRLRSGRFSEVGRIYMVTSSVENRRPIFNDWRLGRLVAHEFRRAEQQGRATTLAWVVMPDHFHWLFELQQGSLAEVVKQVKASSAAAINRATHQSGRLWQTGFHDKAVRREDDLKQMARYIIANPMRAGLVRGIGEYPLWDAVWI